MSWLDRPLTFYPSFLPDVDPDFKRMKEEHLVKMASLKQEAELLKQQAEVEKMRRELKELRGESLPLEENRKVPLPQFCIEILDSPHRHLVSFQVDMRFTHMRFARVYHAGKMRHRRVTRVLHVVKMRVQSCFSVPWPVVIGTYEKSKSRFLKSPIFDLLITRIKSNFFILSFYNYSTFQTNFCFP